MDTPRNVVAAQVPADAARALHQRAHNEGRTVSSVLREAVQVYLGVTAVLDGDKEHANA